MDINYLYKKMEKENINYVNSKLYFSKGAIAHYKDSTAIVLDESQISTSIEEKTTLIQEFGHYMAGAYYKINSEWELVDKMEFKSDKKAWETFFPYLEIKKLMKKGLTTVTEIAEYYDVEAPYMSRCLNYYYNQYGFKD